MRDTSMKHSRVTLLLLLVSVLCLAVGAAQGQAAQVIAKSARICLECIGIG